MRAVSVGRIAIAIVATAMLCTARPADAQDVAITNVRIIVGNGQVINSGTIVVRAGKIASVGARYRRQGHERRTRIHRRS
jgi:imidazolonepropionase-like amidohydrolase